MEIVRKYFSEWETAQPSTYRDPFLSFPLFTSNGAHVRRAIRGFIGERGQHVGDREPGEPEAHHQRVGEGAVLVMPAAPHHHLFGVDTEGGK